MGLVCWFRPAFYKHAAPTGLGFYFRYAFYKHVAPMGLKPQVAGVAAKYSASVALFSTLYGSSGVKTQANRLYFGLARVL